MPLNLINVGIDIQINYLYFSEIKDFYFIFCPRKILQNINLKGVFLILKSKTWDESLSDLKFNQIPIIIRFIHHIKSLFTFLLLLEFIFTCRKLLNFSTNTSHKTFFMYVEKLSLEFWLLDSPMFMGVWGHT